MQIICNLRGLSSLVISATILFTSVNAAPKCEVTKNLSGLLKLNFGYNASMIYYCWTIDSNWSSIRLKVHSFAYNSHRDILLILPFGRGFKHSSHLVAAISGLNYASELIVRGPVHIMYHRSTGKISKKDFFIEYSPYIGKFNKTYSEMIKPLGSGTRICTLKSFAFNNESSWVFTWIIPASNYQLVNIKLSIIETRLDHDFITVYLGNDTSSSAPIFSHSGSYNVSNYQVTAAGTVTITFITDGTTVKGQFEFDYEISNFSLIKYESQNLFRTQFSSSEYNITGVQCSNRNDKCGNQIINPIYDLSSSTFSFESIADLADDCSRFKCNVRFSNVVNEVEIDVNNLQIGKATNHHANHNNNNNNSNNNNSSNSSNNTLAMLFAAFFTGFCFAMAITGIALLLLRAKKCLIIRSLFETSAAGGSDDNDDNNNDYDNGFSYSELTESSGAALLKD